MSYDALHDYPAHHPRRLSRQQPPLKSRSLPQSILGSVALAFVVTTCLWVVYANVVGPDGAAPEPAPAPAAEGPTSNTAKKASRAAAGTSVIQKNYAALLDAGRSLGHPPAVFAQGALPARADQLAMPAQSVGVQAKLQDRSNDQPQGKLQDKLLQAPIARQAALTVARSRWHRRRRSRRPRLFGKRRSRTRRQSSPLFPPASRRRCSRSCSASRNPKA
jgi:hypothetical protein